MKWSRSLPVAYAHLFASGAGLPHGLLYTTLLTPWWGIVLAFRRPLWVLRAGAILLPFVVAHIVRGIDDTEAYLTSLVLFGASIIFLLTVLRWARDSAAVELAIQHLTVAAFAVSLVALVFLPTPFAKVFWTFDNISANIYGIPRLMLFTYEASHLATLLVPLWVYAFARWVHEPSWRHLGWLGMASLPMLLAFSMGILSVLLVAAIVVIARQGSRVWRSAPLTGLVLMGLFTGGLLLTTQNPISERISNLIRGQDTSGNSRTFVSLELSIEVAEMRSAWWGTGLGQYKVVAGEYIRGPQFILPGAVPRLPNAIAETIATFGWIGLGVRLGLQAWLFWAARVWRNDWQVAMFLTMFVFQFGGSFLTNFAELSIWALAASPIVPQPETAPRTSLSPAQPSLA
jgi:hypothetical protein